MALIDLIRKANKTREEKIDVESEKLTPTEREVMSFRERERQDNLKKELAEFRKKNSMLRDDQGMHQSLLAQPASLFHNSKKHNILNNSNAFNNRKHKNLLTSGGGLW